MKSSEDNLNEGVTFHLYGTSLSGIAVDEYLVIQRGVTEKLKTTDQLAWVSVMQQIKQIAEEIIYNDLIFAEI